MFPSSLGVSDHLCQGPGSPGAPQSELLYVALGTGGSRRLTFLLGLQLQAQSHKEAMHCWSDTFKTPPSEPSAIEKFLHGTAVPKIPSLVLTLSEYLAQPQCWRAVFNAICKSTALRGSCAESPQCSPFLHSLPGISLLTGQQLCGACP